MNLTPQVTFSPPETCTSSSIITTMISSSSSARSFESGKGEMFGSKGSIERTPRLR